MKAKYFLLAAVVIFAGLFIYSCSCSSCEKDGQAAVPVDVLNKANDFIISKTGEEFFKKYITVDFVRTKHTPPYFEMAYRLFDPERPYVNATIRFTVDSVGNVMRDRDIIGIPNCKTRPVDCNWSIDREQAIEIAKMHGLEEGIKEWEVGFIWNPKREKYVWHILSTLDEMEGDFGYRGSGKEMIIDPVSGDVLEYNDWHVR